MKKVNNKGFMLAELLIVAVAMMIIFAVLYSNFLPTIGEYEKRLGYNEIDSYYATFYFRTLMFNNLDTTVDSSTYENTLIDNLNSSTNKYVSIIHNSECVNFPDSNKCASYIEAYGIEELIFTYSDIDKTKEYPESLSEYISYLATNESETELYRLIVKTKKGYSTDIFYSRECNLYDWGEWTLTPCTGSDCETGTVYVDLGDWTDMVCTGAGCETRTLYRTATASYTDWSSWTTTSCDTTNTATCKSSTIYQTRSASAVGGRYTNNYCPSSTYGYFQDKSDEGRMCTWKRFKRCCSASSGYCNADCTYNTTGNTTCNYTATVTCTSCLGCTNSYQSTLTMNTYYSATSGWESTTTYPSGTSCGTNSGYTLDSSTPIYKCYNYGAYGGYSEGSCSSTTCVNGYGTCCNQTTGYSTRTATINESDWSEWTTTSCDTNSSTCQSKTQYRVNTIRENPTEPCMSGEENNCASTTGYRTKIAKENSEAETNNYSLTNCGV